MANRSMTPTTQSRGMTPFGRDPMESFRHEVDRLFDDFFTPTQTRNRNEAVWPKVDVRENDNMYTLTAELPGMEQNNVQLSLRDNALILSGERQQEHKEENGGRNYSERFYGRFERVIPFESGVDADKVEANFKNGVLTVTLPKNAKAQDMTRQIPIKAQ
jgi:HSP20 family protein